nr:MAG TPA: hypothetical protein [Caudoviricetes sp.]
MIYKLNCQNIQTDKKWRRRPANRINKVLLSRPIRYPDEWIWYLQQR